MMSKTIDNASSMRSKRFLVVGATGHVGSKITGRLAEKGCDVTAMVRRPGGVIEDPYNGVIKYVVGDLSDEASIRRAVAGIDVVISTANGIIPQKKGDHARSVNEGAERLIALCEAAGVERFVQSSVPSYRHEDRVPELRGKRLIEKRLASSPMQTIVVRNPAFMDVFLVMGGFGGAADRSRHATTKREYGFVKLYMKMIGGLVEKYGLMIAPGGANSGTPTIATRDVAEMIVGAALYEGTDNLLIEAGGPQWLTWRQIADIIGEKTGRKIRIIPLPAWLARLNQVLAAPFSKPAENIFALMGFVASYQPRWNSEEVVRRFHLPKQMTVSDYLDANYVRK
jgi:uncharacterized protein YbjT (DUF2867 family)